MPSNSGVPWAVELRDPGGSAAVRVQVSFAVCAEIALFDAEGGSNISGADFAVAIVDEIDNPAHHREHIGVAY